MVMATLVAATRVRCGTRAARTAPLHVKSSGSFSEPAAREFSPWQSSPGDRLPGPRVLVDGYVGLSWLITPGLYLQLFDHLVDLAGYAASW